MTKPTPDAPPAWPAAAIIMRDLDDLSVNPANARKHPEAQIQNLCKLMREFGWVTAVLVDEKGQLIAGHGRRIAAARLRDEGLEAFKQAPVMVARGWTAAQKRAYALADNRIALQSTWDSAILNAEMGALAGMGVDLGSLGFSEAELFRAMGSGGPGTGTSFDPRTGPAVSRRGDVWVLGEHRIICGDACSKADVEAVLAGAKPHLMVTDPPYGVAYDSEWRLKRGITTGQTAAGKVGNDDQPDWTKAWMLFDGAVAYVWHAGLTASIVQASLTKARFEIRAQIVWVKQSAVIGRGHFHWRHENAWYAVRPGGKSHWQGDRKQSTVWEITHQSNAEGHSTQKPLDAMLRPIINSSAKGDLVYEPFSGSGTTLMACQESGRKCRAVEIEPAYVDLAVRRWQDGTKAVATLEATGQTFEQVEHERLSEKPAAAPRGKRAKQRAAA